MSTRGMSFTRAASSKLRVGWMLLLKVLIGALGGVAHDRRGGQVENRVDLMPVANGLHLQEVRHVAGLDVRTQVAWEQLCRGQGSLVSDGHDDYRAPCHQGRGQVGGGEAVHAGDQDALSVPEVVHLTAFSLLREIPSRIERRVVDAPREPARRRLRAATASEGCDPFLGCPMTPRAGSA